MYLIESTQFIYLLFFIIYLLPPPPVIDAKNQNRPSYNPKLSALVACNIHPNVVVVRRQKIMFLHMFSCKKLYGRI